MRIRAVIGSMIFSVGLLAGGIAPESIYKMLEEAKRSADGIFLTEKEAGILDREIRRSVQDLSRPKLYLLYFFSSSVPKKDLVEFLRGVAILRSNGVSIESVQYLIGPPERFERFMRDISDSVKNAGGEYEKKIAESFRLKFGPTFFKAYEIDKVPVTALAVCDGASPDPRRCKFEYLARGEISLDWFLSKMIDEEKEPIKKRWLRKAYGYLIANKIAPK
jgi:hypothetical protein